MNLTRVPVKRMNNYNIDKSFTADAAPNQLRGMIALTSDGPRTFVPRRKALNKPRVIFYPLTAHSPQGG